MEYWRGIMNWPVAPDWKCETCGERDLIWGFVHGVCRCRNCHAEYTMRPDGEIVDIPQSRLKDEYKVPARAGWQKFHKPISQWNDAMWDQAIALASVTEEVPGE